MHEVEEVCDRVLFLSRGKVLLEGNPRTLPQEHGAATLEELFIRVAREPLAHTGGARMKLRPIAGIVLRQIYLMRGSPVRLFPMVTWVAIDIVLWGFITRYLNTVSGTGVDFVPTLLGGVLLWDFCTRIMQGVTTAFLEDVWSRNFLNLFSSPLSISEYISGLVITSVATSSIGVVVMLLLATGVFHLQFFSMGLPLIGFLTVLFVFGISLGIFAKRHRAAVRPRVRMAAVAAAGAAVALRRRLLSARRTAAVDAGGGACAAAGLCVRGHARAARRPSRFPASCCCKARWWPRSNCCWRPIFTGGYTAMRCAPGSWRATARKAWPELRADCARYLARAPAIPGGEQPCHCGVSHRRGFAIFCLAGRVFFTGPGPVRFKSCWRTLCRTSRDSGESPTARAIIKAP